MIKFLKGDLFDFEADIMVNTVNCVGVMGAGVALAFKNKYPKMFKHYAAQCKKNEIKPGIPTVWSESDFFSTSPKIINFPTKNHWRKPSEYKYIEDGLDWLRTYLADKDGMVVTLPALGCGHGGLDWEVVKTKIEKTLQNTLANVYVFEPSSSESIKKVRKTIFQQEKSLEDVGISKIDINDSSFPANLSQNTGKTFYTLNTSSIHNYFDLTIVASSKPDDNEKIIINNILDYCRKNQLSIVFGSSAFEKNTSLDCNQNGMNTANFIPSGIYDAALKLQNKPTYEFTQLLSTGDPFKGFDRKEYMPSVISRMQIAKAVLFTTQKLDWVAKQKKHIGNESNKNYFINYSTLTATAHEAISSINATPINKNRNTGIPNFTPIKNGIDILQ